MTEKTKTRSRARKPKAPVTISTHWDGTPFTQKRPGVCAVILEVLQNASAASPVTKEEIVAEVLKRIPGRDPQKTRNLVAGCPRWIPLEKGLYVASKRLTGGRFGYWIP